MITFMKLLKIKVVGLPLFKKELEIDFFAKQRVSAEKNEMLTNIFNNIYINNVISLVGINASGKTTSLKVVSFILQMLQNKPINNISHKDILDDLTTQDEVSFEVYFVDEDCQIKKIITIIKRNTTEENIGNSYVILNEKIWSKSFKSARTKNELFIFSKHDLIAERNQDELFLMDDVSIIIALNKKQKSPIYSIDSIHWTNENGLRILDDVPIALVQFLDPSIEQLYFVLTNDNNNLIEYHLKFYNKEKIILYSLDEINKYLSSGTIKGINIFMHAIITLRKGGYMIIDELENHFNKEIVSTLIKFFMDNDINKSGAVLIFSTHYIELLDIFERNDNIYITKNLNGIQIENLSELLERNDIKKSELFQSGYLKYTTPSYEAYINLKRTITKLSKENIV